MHGKSQVIENVFSVKCRLFYVLSESLDSAVHNFSVAAKAFQEQLDNISKSLSGRYEWMVIYSV